MSLSKPRDDSGFPLPLFMAFIVLLVGNSAHAQDSGLGIDLHFGHDVDPARMIGIGCSADGATWLTAQRKRTPTGFLYECIPDYAPYKQTANGWQYQGRVGIGYLSMGGDEKAMLWSRFNNYDDGLIFSSTLSFQRPDNGQYLDIDARYMNNNAQYYRLITGQAGKYRIQAFSRNQSNVLSDNVKSIWGNPGSQHLILKPGLAAGQENAVSLNAFMNADSPSRISVSRSKQGVGIHYYLDTRWNAFANASHERREGSRPFGGPFSFWNVSEPLRPINDNTTNFNGGLRFVGNEWRMEFTYTGSFFRNGMNYFTYEMPQSSLGAAGINPVGSFSYEPENDYHRIGSTFTRRIKGAWKGEFTFGLSLSQMRQNDNLVPSLIACSNGTWQTLIPGAMIDCRNWNSTDSLSRTRADMAIYNQRVMGRLVLQPSDTITWNTHINFLREDYSGNYLAYNPLTGEYGYPAESGAFPSLWNGSNSVRVRNLPLDKQTLDFSTGLNWRLDEHNTLGAIYGHSQIERTHREFTKTNEDSMQLSWINRHTNGWLTTRLNYAYSDRSANNYNFDPYEFTYSVELPGAIPNPALRAHTVDALRKYDVGERKQDKMDVMLTFALPQDMTLYTSARLEDNRYPTQIGRTGYTTMATNVQWEWQPNLSSTIAAWYGYDQSKIKMANVNDDNGDTRTDPTLGGPAYPDTFRWWMADKQRNHNLGFNLRQKIRRAVLDVDWSYSYAKGITSWIASTACAGDRFGVGTNSGAGCLTDTTIADDLVGRFPTMALRINAITASLQFPIQQQTSLRLFSAWERGSARDWHYAGMDNTHAAGSIVLVDGGPSNYSAHLVGLMLEVAL